MISVVICKFCFIAVEIAKCADDNEVNDYDTDIDVSCNAQIADRCFGDVHDDLRVIFDATNKNVKPSNMTLLKELCR